MIVRESDTKKIAVGTKVRYKGDICNPHGRGEVRTVIESKWGTDYVVRLEDGRVLNVSWTAFGDSPGDRLSVTEVPTHGS